MWKELQPNSLLEAKRNPVLKNLGLCKDLQSKKETINIPVMFSEEAQALQET